MDDLENLLCDLIFSLSMDANFVQVLFAHIKRTSDHSLAKLIDGTLTFMKY